MTQYDEVQVDMNNCDLCLRMKSVTRQAEMLK